jgi:fused signal recognition particle receptor
MEEVDAAPADQTTEVQPDAQPDGFAGSTTLWVGGGLLLLLVGFVALGWLARRAPAIPLIDEDTADEDTADEDTADEEDTPTQPAAEISIPAEDPEPKEVGLAARLRAAMGRSRDALQSRFDAILGRELDESALEELEETLLMADVGVETTERVLAALRALLKQGETDPAVLRSALREELRAILAEAHEPLVAPPGAHPWVVLVVGVNGSGKTTTIGKLAARLTGQGKRVMLAAADTYRAAAAEQLEIWAKRSGADIVKHKSGADPGAVAYDALEAAVARGHDVVIIDTAGRLQTRKPLMEQLSKVRRVIGKVVADGPHETLLVLDGTMGQNALSQARLFHEATPLTGVVVTKLDGTAKGGMVLTVASKMKLPVKLIGIGEQIDDLRDFEVDAFVDAIA